MCPSLATLRIFYPSDRIRIPEYPSHLIIYWRSDSTIFQYDYHERDTSQSTPKHPLNPCIDAPHPSRELVEDRNAVLLRLEGRIKDRGEIVNPGPFDDNTPSASLEVRRRELLTCRVQVDLRGISESHAALLSAVGSWANVSFVSNT